MRRTGRSSAEGAHTPQVKHADFAEQPSLSIFKYKASFLLRLHAGVAEGITLCPLQVTAVRGPQTRNMLHLRCITVQL